MVKSIKKIVDIKGLHYLCNKYKYEGLYHLS